MILIERLINIEIDDIIGLQVFRKKISFEIERWAAGGDPGLAPGVQPGHYERQVRMIMMMMRVMMVMMRVVRVNHKKYHKTFKSGAELRNVTDMTDVSE